MERRFQDIHIVCCNPDGLVLCEPRKHRDEIDMGVTEHACPKVSVLGLGAVVIHEDVTKRTSFRGADEGPALPGVTSRKSSSPGSQISLLVSRFPSALLSLENLPTTARATLQSSGSQTSVYFSKVIIVFRTLRDLSRPDSTRNAKSGVGAQPPPSKCLPYHAGTTG